MPLAKRLTLIDVGRRPSWLSPSFHVFLPVTSIFFALFSTLSRVPSVSEALTENCFSGLFSKSKSIQSGAEISLTV